jgi:TetR/AcrR family transcriptional repressor of mexCD-oprJ operon
MPGPSRPAAADSPRRRRSDADRSVTAILDAALLALASDPEASRAEIARRAGLVRATVYAHFPTRESLVDAVTDRAIADSARAIADAEPDRGEPEEALARILATAWRQLSQFHALVAINTRLPKEEFHRRHLPVIRELAPLIERGQKAGAFRSDLPVAWHLSIVLAVVHTASGELRAGRITEAQVEPALITTVLAALGPDR